MVIEAARLVVGWVVDDGWPHRPVTRVTGGNEASARIWETLGFRW